MDKIEVTLFDYANVYEAVKMACLITRSSNKATNLKDLQKEFDSSGLWDSYKVNKMFKLPHSKLSRFITFKFIITGASRRFLSQLITHHVGVDIMSGSLQYSDYTKRCPDDMFVVPYNLLYADPDERKAYLGKQERCFQLYQELVEAGYTNDDAGYAMPMALRNNLFVQVNLEALRWIGNQRLCKRNTDETSYIIGRMIEEVVKNTVLDDSLFMPSCYEGKCKEGKYCCGHPITDMTISGYLHERFPNLYIKK